jgi:hypothetical protein
LCGVVRVVAATGARRQVARRSSPVN